MCLGVFGSEAEINCFGRGRLPMQSVDDVSVPLRVHAFPRT